MKYIYISRSQFIFFVHDMSIINTKEGEHINANHSIINGNNCDIAGNHNIVNGSGNTVIGNHNITNGSGNTVIGNYNIANNHPIGNHYKFLSNETSSSNVPNKRTISDTSRGDSVYIQYKTSRLDDISFDSGTNGSLPQYNKNTHLKLEYLHDKLPEQKDEKAGTSELECTICMNNKRAITFLPCSHSTWCRSCVTRLIKDNKLKCPTCRGNVTGFSKFIF